MSKRNAKAIIEAATALGYTCRMTGSNHLRFQHADTGSVVFTPSTPGDCSRGVKNAIAELRRGAKKSRIHSRTPKGTR